MDNDRIGLPVHGAHQDQLESGLAQRRWPHRVAQTFREPANEMTLLFIRPDLDGVSVLPGEDDVRADSLLNEAGAERLSLRAHTMEAPPAGETG